MRHLLCCWKKEATRRRTLRSIGMFGRPGGRVSRRCGLAVAFSHTLSLPTVVERILRPWDTTGCRTSCEATIAIVVDSLERKFMLDHELRPNPRFLSRVSIGTGSCGLRFGSVERTSGSCSWSLLIALCTYQVAPCAGCGL